MANRNKHQERTALRAHGLDPEITAQPRPIPDELALEASAEPDLSVDADELGSRFLREAIVQGDFDPERAWPGDASLNEGPARDQPLGGTNFVAGNKIWEQTVDLELRTQGAADLLREPAPPSAADDFDEELEEDALDQDAFVARSGVQEFSLFDRPADDGDTTSPPDIQLDEQGSHTRLGARQSPPRTKSIAQGAADGRPTLHERRSKAQQPLLRRLLHTALTLCSKLLRGFANRLQHHSS